MTGNNYSKFMNRKVLYKILIAILLVVVVPIYGMTQDKYVLIESVHKYKITETTGNTYAWIVVTNPNLQTTASTSTYEIIGDADQTEVNIKWKEDGEYYVMVQETNPNGCSIWRAIHIEVIESATIEFKELTSNDCSNVGNTFETELTIGTSGIVDSKFYPIQVYYSIDGAPEATPITVTESKSLVFNDLAIIPEHTDKNQIITILSAKDKYGGDIKVTLTGGVNIHTRTLYGIPIVDDINY